MLDLLRGGVPISLLLDLLHPDGPDSAAIAREEAAPSAALSLRS